MKRSKNYKIKYIKNNLIKSIILLILFLILLILVLVSNIIKNIDYDIKLNTYEIYLAVGEEYKISDENYKYESLNDVVATINNGVIKGVNNGTTNIKVSKLFKSKNIKVHVSDLYTTSILNNDKEYLSCNYYSNEENVYLDKVLEYKINSVGYKTRAGVVEAARFLTLNFPYRIHYFYENGRLLTNGTRKYVDGEGRYYHKGLYLSDSKKESLLATQYGPSIWGCSLYTKILKISTPNGLDCSGFVSWALLNAGFDVGDAGAGIDKKKKNDLDDLGEKLHINKKTLTSVKVGDLLSRDGHIGILIGIDNNTFYVAESLDYDLHVLTYNENELIDSDWTYFINLDNLYINNGALSNMW